MATDQERVFVVGLGVRTPVGHCFQSAGAAVRCGISAYGEHPFMLDRYSEPMVVAMDQSLDDWMPFGDRCVRLAEGAVTDALAAIGSLQQVKIPAILAVGDHPTDESFKDKIAKLISRDPRNSSVQILQEGHAGGLLALELALGKIASCDESLMLVAGIDSYLDPEKLEMVESEGQLHSLNNSWGFTPGEGAGACLLAGVSAINRYRLQPLFEITGVKTASETKLLGTETVCLGEGLSAAFAGVLNDTDKITDVFCDLNGQTYRAEEYGFSICRMGKFFEDASRFVAPAECWGDVGAASPILGMAFAAAAWKGNYSRGSNAMIWSSSANLPLRGAISLKQIEAEAA